MQITPIGPRLAAALTAQSDAYITALYPTESNHLESVSALSQPNVLFVENPLE